jgi:flotillin
VDKMTIISTDGASDLTKTVARNVEQGIQIGSDLTGVDLAALLRRLGSAQAGAGVGNGHLPLTAAGGKAPTAPVG